MKSCLKHTHTNTHVCIYTYMYVHTYVWKRDGKLLQKLRLLRALSKEKDNQKSWKKRHNPTRSCLHENLKNTWCILERFPSKAFESQHIPQSPQWAPGIFQKACSITPCSKCKQNKPPKKLPPQTLPHLCQATENFLYCPSKTSMKNDSYVRVRKYLGDEEIS